MSANIETKNKTQSFYDQIADVHNLALKINGYRASIAKYLQSLQLEINSNSLVLDAGCGTGLVTLSLYSAGYRPAKTFALDLSFNSLEVAAKQFADDETAQAAEIETIQGNLLTMPFQAESVDFVLTCGALEYVPLDKGIPELARVLKPNGRLILIPIHPSLIGYLLEVLYDFKTHSADKIKTVSETHFDIIDEHKFPSFEPISWSKSVYLLRKK